ncbi:MAG: hypothetical protein AW10_00583 [Candidatus Accumulibacter appositus]|uniref:Uncharacterized protein n=1 Tax=Candidatus Accumulibacter appositus TaxID=1454003 RepID=A0A011Q001_9PROT|nr:hypothetical protein [Accumulibacter sp.]EXI82475.1 MAG: hypothetical protein AW10_00583 [Candidatus Accumulibacter appositus]HRF03032.1 hypothetical protein [Accumulibacter sp.]
MGILDWFMNRPAQFDTDRVSETMIRGATEKAITLTNPRLSVLPSCHARLAPAVDTTIRYLRAMVEELPGARPVSPAIWSADRALRAFFVAPSDIHSSLGRSENLRTLFAKYPVLDEACVLMGMSFNEQRVFGIALHGEIVRRDVVQTRVSFSDHRAHICAQDEAELRRLIGAQAFEYVLAQALSQIAEVRVERQELEANRALIRARLRLLRRQGPGLGSMFAGAPAGASEQAELQAKLLENERQLEAIGDSQAALEMELECLKEVLEHPQRSLSVAQKHLRLDTMNVLSDDASSDRAADVSFSLAELSGPQPLQRAFVLARFARAEMASPTINFDAAARYL